MSNQNAVTTQEYLDEILPCNGVMTLHRKAIP